MSTPLGAVNWTGHTFGSVSVMKLANSSPRNWLLRCNTCESEWTVPERIPSVYYASGLPIPCRLEACRYGRLQPTKITGYERDYLNAPDPQPKPEPKPPKTEPVRVEQVSTDYLRYLAVCQRTGQADVRSWSEFENLGQFLHRKVMDQVWRLEEKYGI
jgi:hypothetical protein